MGTPRTLAQVRTTLAERYEAGFRPLLAKVTPPVSARVVCTAEG